ncbi:hypothetical protein GQR36_18940 [Enterococcus termitis]
MRVVKEHDERKNEIIDTAETFFITKGYDKTTINDILKKSVLPKEHSIIILNQKKK